MWRPSSAAISARAAPVFSLSWRCPRPSGWTSLPEPTLLEVSEAETLTPVVARQYTRFIGDTAEAVDAGVIGEIRFTVFVEDRELVTLMCSPYQLRPLVVGFLYLEGLIESVDD